MNVGDYHIVKATLNTNAGAAKFRGWRPIEPMPSSDDCATERLPPILAFLDDQVEDVEPFPLRSDLRQTHDVKATQVGGIDGGDSQERAIGAGESRVDPEVLQSKPVCWNTLFAGHEHGDGVPVRKGAHNQSGHASRKLVCDFRASAVTRF